MSDIQVVDQLDNPVESIPVDLGQPSSLIRYLKTHLLHFAVFPDFLAKKDLKLSEAATKPISFQGTAKHGFSMGAGDAQITITPLAQAVVQVNATPGSDLFEDEPFAIAATVPDNTGYTSIGFEGSLDAGVSELAAKFTFGFGKMTAVTLEYWKAFSLDTGGPTLGEAMGSTLSSFVIPADLPDVAGLRVHDIAAASGEGTLHVSGSVSVSAIPNPLASAGLPLALGSVAVQTGLIVGLAAQLSISGKYQVRVRCLDRDLLELSFLKRRGTVLKTDVSASGGILATLGKTELISKFLDAVSKAPLADRTAILDLTPGQQDTLSDAIKGGIDRSLTASLDIILSRLRDEEAAFQYRIQPSRLSPESAEMVRRGLAGDLTRLTEREEQGTGELAPGITMMNSVFTTLRKRTVTFKINLIGLLNVLSISQLVRKSEVLIDNTTGTLTIHETASGNNITAVTEPELRHQALCKVLFNSVMVTASYRAGKAVSLPELKCDGMHFALHKNTSQENLADYLNWFAAFNLMTTAEKKDLFGKLTAGGLSTCVVRTSFNDAECSAMFFAAGGTEPHPAGFYLELGRRAMRALLDPEHNPVDQLRFRIVDDALWPQALKLGANPALAGLVNLSQEDPRLNLLIGDVYVITHWADAMTGAGKLTRDMRDYISKLNPTAARGPDLKPDPEFKRRCDALRDKWAEVIQASRTRFEQPWGMLCLYWAGGSPQTAEAKAVTQSLTMQRSSGGTLAAAQSSTR